MRYVNPHERNVSRGWFHFLLWQLGYYRDLTPPSPVPKDFIYPNPNEQVDLERPLVTWVNHSTFWVRAGGKSLLIDPIWGKRCSPLRFLGPKRLHPPSPKLETITQLDVVVITHNHYDHLDYFTVNQLSSYHPKALWVVPRGVKRWFDRFFPKVVVQELDWWESYAHDSMTFTAVPAQHFSGRGIFDRDCSLWMGCVVEFNEGRRLYIAGDTGYNAFDFKEIGDKFSGVELSLIPIGVYMPRAFMRGVHVNPQESLQIHLDVGSKLSVGGHFGTFRLSSEERERPPFDLYCALEEFKLSHEKFRVLTPGQTINWL